MRTWDVGWFRCPQCGGSILGREQDLSCAGCGAFYPVRAGVPLFFDGLIGADSRDEKKFWEKECETDEDGGFRTFEDGAYRGVIDAFELPREGLGLDYACGSGSFSFFVHGPDVVGLDISETLLGAARHLVPVQGSGEALPFVDGLFDFVIAAAALHHMPRLDLAFSEIARVTRPGGLLCLLEMNCHHPQRKLVAGRASRFRSAFGGTHFSPAEALIPEAVIGRHLGGNGYTVTRREYLSPRYRNPSTVGRLQRFVSERVAPKVGGKYLESYLLVRAVKGRSAEGPSQGPGGEA